MKFSGWMKIGMNGHWELIVEVDGDSLDAEILLAGMRRPGRWCETVVLPDGETPDTRVRLGKEGAA